MSLLRKTKKIAAMACVTALLSTQFAYGAPTNPEVVAGSATISGVKDMLVNLAAGKGAIINWGAFDTAADEKVTFNFAPEGGAVLNRVTGGGGASTLSGVLTTTGSTEGMVFIINPQGVTWSAQSSMMGGTSPQAIVPYLTLSSLNVSNQDFINFMNSDRKTKLSYSNKILDGVNPSLITAGSFVPGMIDMVRGTVGINDNPAAEIKGLALIGGTVRITPPRTYSVKVATRGATTIIAGTDVTIHGTDFSSWSDFKSNADNTVVIGTEDLNWRVLLWGSQLNVLGNSIAILGGPDNTDETRLENPSAIWTVTNPDGSVAPNQMRLVAANEATQTGITGAERIEDRGFTMSATAANSILLNRSRLRSSAANARTYVYGGNITLERPVYDANGNPSSPSIENGIVGASKLVMVAANNIAPDGTITTGAGNNVTFNNDSYIVQRDVFIAGNKVTLGSVTAEGADGTGGVAAIFAGNSIKFYADATGVTSGQYQAGATNNITVKPTATLNAKIIDMRANSISNAGKIKVLADGSADLYAFKSMDEYLTDPDKATVLVDNTSSVNSTGTVENAGTVFAVGNTVNIAGADTQTDIIAVGSATSGNLANTGLAVTADASEADAANAPFDKVVIDKTNKTAIVTSTTWALWKTNTALADAVAALNRAETAKTAAEQAAANAAAAAANAAAAKATADQAALDAAAAVASGSVQDAAAAAAAAAKAAIDADVAKSQAATAQVAADQAAANAANEAAAARAAATLATQVAAKAPADKADAANAAASQAAAQATAAETAAANSQVAKAAAKTAADNAAADAAAAAAQAAIAKTEAAKVGVTEESLQAAADAAQAAVNAAAAQAAAVQAAAEAETAAAAAAAAQAAADQAAADAAYALDSCDVTKAAEAKVAAAAAKTAAEQAAAEAATKAAAAKAAADQAAAEATAAQAAASKTPIPQAATDATAAAQAAAAAKSAADSAAAAKAASEQAAAAAAKALAKATADADATLPPKERSEQLSKPAVVENKLDYVAATQPKPQFPAEHANRTGAPSGSDDAVTVPEVQ